MGLVATKFTGYGGGFSQQLAGLGDRRGVVATMFLRGEWDKFPTVVGAGCGSCFVQQHQRQQPGGFEIAGGEAVQLPAEPDRVAPLRGGGLLVEVGAGVALGEVQVGDGAGYVEPRRADPPAATSRRRRRTARTAFSARCTP